MLHLSLSVVIYNLDIVGITIDEPKADTPLVVDRDGILSLPLPPKLVQPITWRNPKII